MRKSLVGVVVGVAATIALTALLLPLRANVNVSTVTLIFIIPVIVGVVFGGLATGLVTVTVSALLLDFYFIPPYGTLSIGSTQNWTGLAVYLVVVVIVSRVVANLKTARTEAHQGVENMRRVYELSEHLVQDQSVDDLLQTIVRAVQGVFGIDGVSLFVLEEGHLKVAASVGEYLSEAELARLDPPSGSGVNLSTARATSTNLRTISLSAAGRPIGLLVLKGARISDMDQAVLITFANDAAIALERAQLREQAVRSELLEEVDRLRHALMGAVSHDLRTPLATIKVASSTLVNRASLLSAEDAHELHDLIELEADRLTRLVTNLLDMTRIEAGVLKVDRSPTTVPDLVREALSVLGSSLKGDRVALDIESELPLVDIDNLLMVQVLVNLLDNAVRHSPKDSPITVRARADGDHVNVSVSDHGSGVAVEDRATIFDRFVKFDTGGRAGLGLTIAKTFVEAHGETIWYEEADGGGASFVFSLTPVRSTREEGH